MKLKDAIDAVAAINIPTFPVEIRGNKTIEVNGKIYEYYSADLNKHDQDFNSLHAFFLDHGFWQGTQVNDTYGYLKIGMEIK